MIPELVIYSISISFSLSFCLFLFKTDHSYFVLFFNTFCHARLLNANLLKGQVPDELYSIGVHGGAIEYVAFI